MSEFGDRLAAQRSLLRVVNSHQWREELFGLSSHALHRWGMANQLDAASEIVLLLHEAADRLRLLANKSQEHIRDDYARISHEVRDLTTRVEAEPHRHRRLAGDN